MNELLNLKQILFPLVLLQFSLSRTIVIYQIVDFLASFSAPDDIFEGGFIVVMIGDSAAGARKSRLALQ